MDDQPPYRSAKASYQLDMATPTYAHTRRRSAAPAYCRLRAVGDKRQLFGYSPTPGLSPAAAFVGDIETVGEDSPGPLAEFFSAGPLVLVMPTRGVQGGTSDAWQIVIPGTEQPGRYLVLAPGQQVRADVACYTVLQSPTFNIFLGVRLTRSRCSHRGYDPV